MNAILTGNGLKPLIRYSHGVEKFGRNIAVGTTREDIWDGGGEYNWMTVPQIISIVSTDANDTLAGTGLQKLYIQGLNADNEKISEIVEMNGITPVNTVNTYYRIFRCYGSQAGVAVTNLGTITLTGLTDVFTVAMIRIGIGQTNMAITTIPKNHTGFLHKWYCSLTRATGVNAVAVDVDILHRNGGVWRSVQPIGLQNNGSGNWKYEFGVEPEFTELTDIRVVATATAVADVSAGFTLLCFEQKNIINPSP